MENGKCILGSIVGCLTYSDATTCSKCKENYMKVTIKNSDYCFPIPHQELCENYSATFSYKILECIKCLPGYTISENTDDFKS